VSFMIPHVISGRLDDLVDRANAAGENTNRKELIAAIILACNLDGSRLSTTLRKYRKSTVESAILNSSPDTHGQPIEVGAKKPGPRRRSSE
jgi:hypothetical protein